MNLKNIIILILAAALTASITINTVYADALKHVKHRAEQASIMQARYVMEHLNRR